MTTFVITIITNIAIITIQIWHVFLKKIHIIVKKKFSLHNLALTTQPLPRATISPPNSDPSPLLLHDIHDPAEWRDNSGNKMQSRFTGLFVHRVNMLDLNNMPLCSSRLLIERLQVWILTEATGEFSSPASALCVDSYSMSVPLPCYRSVA